MNWNPRQTLQNFYRAAELAGVKLATGDVCLQKSGDPHKTKLPEHCGGVYVFACKTSGKFLKVGQAGPNSDPRFRSHHYYPHGAKSTLAASLLTLKENGLRNRYLPKSRWVDSLPDRDNFPNDSERRAANKLRAIKIKDETRRTNFFVAYKCRELQDEKSCVNCENCRKAGFILNFLEAFLQLKLQPFFEGQNYGRKRNKPN